MSELRERLTSGREEFVRSVLRDPAAQTLSAHLFLDAFFESIDETIGGGDPRGTLAFLRDALSIDSPLRPPAVLADALASALRGEVEDSRLRIREIERAITAAFSVAEEVAARAMLDEVDAAIDALVVRLETIDPLTAEHSRAVASWCGRIGRAMGVRDAEVVDLSRAGLVHDIGKASVPAEILKAPRALDEHEWTIVRGHVLAGDDIVFVQPIIEPYRDAIVSHHERLDGSGYPHGVRGDAIPLQARVVAVADTFNAMIGHRPYRAPFAPAEALDEIERASGTHFDPDVVNALASVLGA